MFLSSIYTGREGGGGREEGRERRERHWQPCFVNSFRNPQLEKQASDRCHRFGQIRDVVVHRCVCVCVCVHAHTHMCIAYSKSWIAKQVHH